MSLMNAIQSVLAESGKPLSSHEITQLILDHGLWKIGGKTPHATVEARIAVDIKEQGVNSRFQRTDKSVFALRQWRLPEYSRTKHIRAISQKVKTYSFTDAAEFVLEKYGNKKPMHYRAITKKALDRGLIQTEGQTPEATLYAQILTEIARKARRGNTPRFVKHGKGFVGLSRWMATGLAFQIDQHNTTIRKKLRARLGSMHPPDFEALIGKLLVAIGFEDVTVTRRSSDGGIDVRATLVVGNVIRTRMAVQVKRWKKNVQSPIVQQVRGSLGTHEQGLIITTSDFGSGAQKEAERLDAIPVALMNGEQLVALLVENDIGVSRTSYNLFELSEEEEI